MDAEPGGLGGATQRAEHRLVIDGAIFGGVGQRERGGPALVRAARLGQRMVERGGVDPALDAGQRLDLQPVTEETGRAALVHDDVRLFERQHRSVRRTQRGAGDRIGDGAGRYEADLGIGVEQRADRVGGLGGDRIGAVARDETAIGGGEGGQRLGADAGGVVREEFVTVGHGGSLAQAVGSGAKISDRISHCPPSCRHRAV